MPIVMNPQHLPSHSTTNRTPAQKVAITMGSAFIVVGILGVVMPGLMSMHLSSSHNLIHLVSGALALWCGFTKPNRAFNFCLGFGAVYGLLGIAGFLMGEPGYPSVGHLQADQNLFRIVPGVLELGTMDHLIHLFISSLLLFTAYTFRKDPSSRRVKKRTI